LTFLLLLQAQEFQLELHQVEHVEHKVEIQHLELQVSHFIWLHTAEVQHREMGSLVHVGQEQIILQELDLVVADKVTGLILGALAVVEAELEELENIQTYSSLTLADIQDITVEAETHQKVLQEEAQDGQTQTILEEDLLEVEEAQVFMV
jgi:hypothetical protein